MQQHRAIRSVLYSPTCVAGRNERTVPDRLRACRAAAKSFFVDRNVKRPAGLDVASAMLCYARPHRIRMAWQSERQAGGSNPAGPSGQRARSVGAIKAHTLHIYMTCGVERMSC